MGVTEDWGARASPLQTFLCGTVRSRNQTLSVRSPEDLQRAF